MNRMERFSKLNNIQLFINFIRFIFSILFNYLLITNCRRKVKLLLPKHLPPRLDYKLPVLCC
jgi:hypothetical protein